MTYEPPTRPCPTCDDDLVHFAGDWLHAGTDYDDRCPTLFPEISYRPPSHPVRAAAKAAREAEQSEA